jgi:hypothetical protein
MPIEYKVVQLSCSVGEDVEKSMLNSLGKDNWQLVIIRQAFAVVRYYFMRKYEGINR